MQLCAVGFNSGVKGLMNKIKCKNITLLCIIIFSGTPAQRGMAMASLYHEVS
jgi:hypothetical protein